VGEVGPLGVEQHGEGGVAVRKVAGQHRTASLVVVWRYDQPVPTGNGPLRRQES